jgi:hypothetical protein
LCSRREALSIEPNLSLDAIRATTLSKKEARPGIVKGSLPRRTATLQAEIKMPRVVEGAHQSDDG